MAMVISAAVAAFVLAQGAQLPKLVVPKGSSGKPVARMAKAKAAKGMTAAQVKAVVAASRPVKAVLPWAKLDVRHMDVGNKAYLEVYGAAEVNGEHNQIRLTQESLQRVGFVNVRLNGITPNKLYVVVVNGSSQGSGTVGLYNGNGIAEVSVKGGTFSFPVAVTDDDPSTIFQFVPRSPIKGLTIDSVEIWEAN